MLLDASKTYWRPDHQALYRRSESNNQQPENQRKSEKIRENQRKSEKIREDQRKSEKIREIAVFIKKIIFNIWTHYAGIIHNGE